MAVDTERGTVQRWRARGICLFLVAALAVGTAASSPGADEPFQHAVVAADHELASAAGVEVLARGGNVVDAAVAVSFALAVVRPESCGLGGGGFMLIWDAREGRAVALDYGERAPQAASRDMFTQDGLEPHASRAGGLAVAVPGTVAGLCYALEHFGTLSREEVMAPALRLAREGFAVDQTMREGRADALHEMQPLGGVECGRDRFPELFALYLDPIASSERFRSPLAEVLRRIAAEGPAGFYDGPIGCAIVKTVQHAGGVLALDDLRQVRPVVRQPLARDVHGDRIITMPPPSSGGIALLQSIGILQAYEAAHPDHRLETLGHNTPDDVHLVTEALKHAFADRARYLGDADFVDVPIDSLLDEDSLALLAADIAMDETQSSDEYGHVMLPDDAGTSHFSILDSHGNAVACTETVNTAYGSLVVVPHDGIVLNNEMDDFSTVPGQPNAFGLIQSERNAIAPGKKPLSSMSPTIVVRDGKAIYVAGGSGGPRIISATLQVLLNMLRFGMSPHDAVSAPRFHHQWSPEELLLEPALYRTLHPDLVRKGHATERVDDLGAVQAAVRTESGVAGGSDPRKRGRPRGR